MNGLMLYKGKYGATMQYAMWAADALKIRIVNADDAREADFEGIDYVIIGTSVYIGKLQIAAWLEKNGNWLKDRKLIFFIVAGTPVSQTATLTGYFVKGVPEKLRDGASCFFLPGRLHFKGLSLWDKILLSLGARLTAKEKVTISLKDYNDVKKEHLEPLLQETRHLKNCLS